MHGPSRLKEEDLELLQQHQHTYGTELSYGCSGLLASGLVEWGRAPQSQVGRGANFLHLAVSTQQGDSPPLPGLNAG